jgi:16S rRNA (guanine527-N7)-methyltransferase
VFHVKHEGLACGAVSLGVELGSLQLDLVERYETLLETRAGALGMIGRADLPRLRERHLLDSLRAAPVVPSSAASVLDMGSGAGLPGIPLAIARPDLSVTLAETRHQRIAFLELAVEELALPNVSVHAGRAEDAPRPVDVCLARAFRDVAASWKVAAKLLTPGGCLVYFAGARFDPVRDVPAHSAATVAPTSSLANAGPLVIMTRQ